VRVSRPKPVSELSESRNVLRWFLRHPGPVTATAHKNLVGLARVSTETEDAQLQRNALTEAGCSRIFEERVSTRKTDRPGLAAALDYLRPGDTLCVWKLDRLGRSVKGVMIIADDLHDRGIGVPILTGKLSGTYTSTGEGKFFFTMMAVAVEVSVPAAAWATGRVGVRSGWVRSAHLAAFPNQDHVLGDSLNTRVWVHDHEVGESALRRDVADVAVFHGEGADWVCRPRLARLAAAEDGAGRVGQQLPQPAGRQAVAVEQRRLDRADGRVHDHAGLGVVKILA